jgi:hypothetical protein
LSNKYKTVHRGGKQIYVHRLLMERALGRQLRRDELVHHKNGDPRDNRLENLEVVTRAEHAKIHGPERKRKESSVPRPPLVRPWSHLRVGESLLIDCSEKEAWNMRFKIARDRARGRAPGFFASVKRVEGGYRIRRRG